MIHGNEIGDKIQGEITHALAKKAVFKKGKAAYSHFLKVFAGQKTTYGSQNRNGIDSALDRWQISATAPSSEIQQKIGHVALFSRFYIILVFSSVGEDLETDVENNRLLF